MSNENENNVNPLPKGFIQLVMPEKELGTLIKGLKKLPYEEVEILLQNIVKQIKLQSSLPAKQAEAQEP